METRNNYYIHDTLTWSGLSQILGLRNCYLYGYFDPASFKENIHCHPAFMVTDVGNLSASLLKRPPKIHRQPSLLLQHTDVYRDPPQNNPPNTPPFLPSWADAIIAGKVSGSVTTSFMVIQIVPQISSKMAACFVVVFERSRYVTAVVMAFPGF